MDDDTQPVSFARWGPETPRVMVAPGLDAASPVRLEHDRSTVYDVELEIVALPMSDERAGRFACREVVVRQRQGGPMVTSEGLRSVPIGRLVHGVAVGNVERVGQSASLDALGELNPQRLARLREAGPTQETLATVARIYRWGLVIGDAPGVMVEENFDVSRRTAGRWIALARERGHLGPLEGPGRAGG